MVVSGGDRARPHRLFKVGDLVRILQAAPIRDAAEAFIERLLRTSMVGIYEVITILPDAKGEPQYRLKGIAGTLEQTARQSEITAAVRVH